MSKLGIVMLYFLHGFAALLLPEPRFSLKKTAGICGLVVALQIAVAFGFWPFLAEDIWVYVVFLITALLLIALFVLISAEPFPKTLFLMMTYAQAFLLLTFLSGYLSMQLFANSKLARVWIRTLLQGAGILIYRWTGKARFDAVRREVTQSWWPMCLLSFLLMLDVSYLAIRGQANGFYDSDLISFILLLAVMLSSYGVIFYTVRYMHKASQKDQVEQHREILRQKLELMETAAEESRRIRHDIRHHLLNLMQYAKRGENEALIRYLEEYGQALERAKQVRLCADPVIDQVLTVYRKRAEQKKIRMELESTLLAKLEMEELDLVAIFSGLMEQAIGGCCASAVDARLIRLVLGSKADKLVLRLEYTCDQNAAAQGEAGEQNQKRMEQSALLRSVKKYGGDVDFCESDGMMIGRIVIPQNCGAK